MVKFYIYVSFHQYISFIGVYLTCVFEKVYKGIDGNIVIMYKRRGGELEMTLSLVKRFCFVCLFVLENKQWYIKYNSLK